MVEKASQLEVEDIGFFEINPKYRKGWDGWAFYGRVVKKVEVQKGNSNLLVSVLTPDGEWKVPLSLGGGTKARDCDAVSN